MDEYADVMHEINKTVVSISEKPLSLDHLQRGGMVVIVDMSLAVCSVVINLIVITGIKEREATMGMFNLLLANLCLSNLTSAAIVKSISIVHNGYAVAANTTQSTIAFCNIMIVSYRATWAVLPWTIFTLSWMVFFTYIKVDKDVDPEESTDDHPLSPLPNIYSKDSDLVYSGGSVHSRITAPGSLNSRVADSFHSNHSFCSNITSHSSEKEKPKQASPEPDEKLVLSFLEKCLLVLVWTMSLAYSVLTPQLVSDKMCDVREDPLSTLGAVSVFIAIVLPLILGPISSMLAILMATIFSSCGRSKKKDEDSTSHITCLVLLTVMFLITYGVSMVFSEIYFEDINNIMYFILLKYCFGTLHHFLGPVIILLSYKDLRQSVVRVFVKGGTNQNESKEISTDEMKKELGHL